MSETIQTTILKRSAVPALNNWKRGEQEIERCYECESALFYAANTKGLLYSPELDMKVVGRTPDWENYRIETSFTNHICAVCGASQGGVGTWQHIIFELDEAEYSDDYEEALKYLQTGTLPAGAYHDGLLRLAEEIKEKTVKYWTRHNITEAILHEKAEAKKKGLNQIKEQNDNYKGESGISQKVERSTPS